MFLTFELGLTGLFQAQILPGEISSILIQLPVVGLFVWYVLHSNKQNREQLERLLEIQERRHEHSVELFKQIIDRMDTRQAQMADRVEILTQQLSMNTATVNESMRLAELKEALENLAHKE
jgi:hypothetical protein